MFIIVNEMNDTGDKLCDIDLEKLDFLGKGSFGKVYKWTDDKVIKSVDIGNRAPYMYKKVNAIVLAELNGLVKARRMMAEGVSHGFAVLYDFAKCEIEESEDMIERRGEAERGRGDISLHNVGVRFVMKYYPLSFSQIMRRMTVDTWKHRDIKYVWLNIMFKLWYNIHVMHEKMGIAHGDLDLNNVMFEPYGDELEQLDRNWTESRKRRGYFKYVIHGEEYYIPNGGYRPVIIDFGESVDLVGVGDEKEKERLMRKDYQFFFTEEKWDDHGGLLLREDDIKEAMYKHFNVQQIIDKLGGKDSEEVRKAFADVRRKFPNLKGERFMKKIHTALARKIGSDIALYKAFNRNFELLESVQRPAHIVKEFHKRLKSKKGWKKEDMYGELRETSVLD